MAAPGLSRQTITVPFSGGVDQKKDPKQIPPGSFTRLVNCVRTHDGRVEKRRGSNALPLTCGGRGAGPALITAAKKLATYDGQLLAMCQDNQPQGGKAPTSTRLYSWSPTLQELVLADNLPDVAVKRGSPVAWTNSISDPGVAYIGGYAVYAWYQGQKIYVSVIDDSSGATVANAQIVYDLGAGHPAQNLKIIYPGTGTKFAFFFSDPVTSLQRIYGIIGDLSMLASTGLVGLAARVLVTASAMGFAGPGVIFDACALGTGYVVATADQTGIGSAKYYRLDANLTVLAGPITTIVCGSGLGGAAEDVRAIGVCATAGEAIHVAVATSAIPGNTGHRLQYHANNPTTDASLAAQIIIAVGGTLTIPGWSVFSNFGSLAGNPAVGMCRVPTILGDATCCIVFHLYSPDTGGLPMMKAFNVGAVNGVPGGVQTTYNTRLLSKPFYASGRKYVLALDRDAKTTFLVDVMADEDNNKPSRPVATIGPRISKNSAVLEERSGSSLAEIVQGASATDRLSVSPIVQSALLDSLLGAASVRIDLAPVLSWQGTELGKSAQLTGGMPCSFDGLTACEIGFLKPPAIISLAQDTATAGNLTLGVNYTYVVVATWIDAKGQVHRSQPSAPVTYAMPGGGQASIKFRVRCLNLTCRTDSTNQYTPKVKLEIYRTVANGTKLLRTQSVAATDQDTTAAKWDSFNCIYNDVTLEYTNFINDGVADTILAGSPAIYTDGNVLESVCPPSSTRSFVYKQRLCLIGCDDGKQVWMAQPVLDGEAIRFTDLNVFRVDDGGDLTGGIQLDQVMILTKLDRVFYVTGDGSSDTGQGSDLSYPTKIATDKGCIDQRSMVVFPEGLAYQATTGLVLLDRGMNVDPGWGRPVQDLLQTYPVITSALVDKDGGQVRFEALTAEGSAVGITIVYDYVNKQWGWFEHFNNGDAGIAQKKGSVSAVMWNGVYTRVTAGGQIYTEKLATDATACLDQPTSGAASVWVTMICEGSDIALGTLVGAMRVWKVSVLGQYQSAHDLKIEIALNFGQVFEPARYFDSHFVSALPGLPVEQVEVGLKQQRVESVRVRVTDGFPSAGGQGNGAGVALSAFSFDIGTRPRRHPQAITSRST